MHDVPARLFGFQIITKSKYFDSHVWHTIDCLGYTVHDMGS